MADLTIPASAQALTPATPPVRSETALAGQRAFFNQALANVQATAPVRMQPQTTPSPSAPMRPDMSSAPNEPPSRMLRPGSLLDIKV